MALSAPDAGRCPVRDLADLRTAWSTLLTASSLAECFWHNGSRVRRSAIIQRPLWVVFRRRLDDATMMPASTLKPVREMGGESGNRATRSKWPPMPST